MASIFQSWSSVDTAIRQGTSIGRPGLLIDPSTGGRSASGMTVASSQKARRPSATTRDSSKARRHSRAPRGDDDYLDAAVDGRYGPLDEEDDEVEPHDRGEELVRRRMKARQREKALRKKAEKERSRQSVAYGQSSGNPALLSPSLKPSSAILGQRPSSPSLDLIVRVAQRRSCFHLQHSATISKQVLSLRPRRRHSRVQAELVARFPPVQLILRRMVTFVDQAPTRTHLRTGSAS